MVKQRSKEGCLYNEEKSRRMNEVSVQRIHENRLQFIVINV